MSRRDRCQAVERGLRCNALPPTGSKWCTRHEELQAKSLKTYKRFSFEFEGYQECPVLIKQIKASTCQQELHEWATCLRKKWVLIKRVVDARIKHHQLFYAGGDASHQAFIDNLTKQRVTLEEKLMRIDERAYELFKHTEEASWLDRVEPTDPSCEETTLGMSTLSIAEEKPVIQEVVEVETAPGSDQDDAASTALDEGEEDEEDLFSDVESKSGSSDSCTSPCCQPAPLPPPASYRGRMMAYLDFPAFMPTEEDKIFAKAYMDNIIRYAISRIPSLLVRAKSANCSSVECFLTSEDLQEPEYARLWRGLKYNNVHTEGKLTVQIIKNAICDAEHRSDDRIGPSIDLLGGRVWKDGLKIDLTRKGWDHFYRFTSCTGCALSVTHSFEVWSKNRLLSGTGNRYSSWNEENELPAEALLRECEAVICGCYRKGRLGAMEHVKPKKRGLRSVWIERDFRNWCFLRMRPSSVAVEAFQQIASSTVAVCMWPPSEGVSNVAEEGNVWVSRLRSGYNATDRRSAKWTIDSSFHYTSSTHERLLSTSPEAHFHQGKAFDDGSLDVLLIDTGTQQNFEKFLDSVASKLAKTLLPENGNTADLSLSATVGGGPLLDRALYLGRQLFRETL